MTTGRVLDLLANTHPSSPVDTGPGQVALDTMSPDNLLPQAQEAAPAVASQSSVAPVSRVNFISGLN